MSRWRWSCYGLLALVGTLAGAGPAGAGESPTYLAFYGAFDETPFAIIAGAPGAVVKLRRDAGIRAVRLDPATAIPLLRGMIPVPRVDIPGVEAYTDFREKGVAVSYPSEAVPTFDITEPTAPSGPGAEGGEGGGNGAGGGGGGM